jgi:carbonic anhydrase/acetyltransferase-like protein (isoleucine patch superfamily)
MRIRHLDMTPSVHPETYVAPTAVPGGEVRVGRGSCIMHGAVVAAEGGPVEIGAHCVIMENAVLRAGRVRRSGPDDVVEEVLGGRARANDAR